MYIHFEKVPAPQIDDVPRFVLLSNLLAYLYEQS